MTKTPEAGKPVLAPITLFYAFWDEDGERHEAGEVVHLPATLARALIKEGKAERADPMPGEE